MSRSAALAAAIFLLATSFSSRGDEKLVVLDDLPRHLGPFEVAPDGSRLYFGSGSDYLTFDGQGKLIDRFGLPSGAARELSPLPNGWFIAFNSHAGGHIALFRPDGTEVRKLATRGGDEQHLRHDMTGWTSPTGGAVDVGRKLLFALDTSMAQRGEPDPVWSRIAVFDFEGKYLRDINRYDAKAEKPLEPRRTWYDDIEVDPERQRVYVTARRTNELMVFGYDGKPVLFTAGRGGIAVFPDGRVAVGTKDGRGIQVYGAELDEVKVLPFSGMLDLETDADGRLYASTQDPSITFVRWEEELELSESFGPRYRRLRVDFPDTAAVAGEPLRFKVSVEGRPKPTDTDGWQVLARPTDGSDLRWQRLPSTFDKDILTAATPETLRGFHEVAVRFGRGPIPLADRERDLTLQKTFAFRRQGAERSVAVITATGRRVFGSHESIALRLIRRDANGDEVPVTVELQREGQTLRSQVVRVRRSKALQAMTYALRPGHYTLRPTADGHESYPLTLRIGSSRPGSPMQRILYHEFDNEAITMRQNHLADLPERMAYIRDYVDAVGRLGFTRETDRLVGKLNTKTDPRAWLRDYSPVRLDHPAYALPEYYAIPSPHSQWEAEYYLDHAARHGIRYDTQLLGHCSGVRFRDEWIEELVPILQRTAQWLGKYPSFYGFNYNDEMFFGQWVTDWKQEDKDWLKTMHETQFKGRPMADVYMQALRKMYGAFNEGVRLANRNLMTTATPMWQFPAVDGSYPPVIYEGMSESYSHYLSEGYHYPWYPAHSVDAVRRPGKPLMGVFDNSYSGRGGDCYLQDLLQVAARGVQGVGVQHTRPWKDARGASAYRTGNRLMEMYGGIFAQCPPANEGAILYSYTQDVTENRNMMGTPHWERVFTLHSAGLMAGVPMCITFEEDVADGWLLADGKPRLPMLFLVGQTEALPPEAAEAVAGFVAKGGRVFTDADSADFPGATKLDIHTHVLKSQFHEGYAADTTYPLFQPVLERLAADLKAAAGQYRRFPVDTDTPWVAVNQFDGGDVRYLALTTDEGSPYPWRDAGTVWSLGALYRFSVLPKTTVLTFPLTKGAVVYDVFEQKVVEPHVNGRSAKLAVDLRTFPGRLFAIAPQSLGRPRLQAQERDGTEANVFTPSFCTVQMTDGPGNPLPLRVPIRIRKTSQGETLAEYFALTDQDGSHRVFERWPDDTEELSLEVTELLSGQSTTVSGSRAPSPAGFLRSGEQTETHVDFGSLQTLLARAGKTGSIALVLARPGLLDEQDVNEIRTALAGRDIEVVGPQPLPSEPKPGVTIIVGHRGTRETMGELLWVARQRGLLRDSMSPVTIPRLGPGSIFALIAPRAHEEHFLALFGNDRTSLKTVVSDFSRSLGIRRGIYSGRAGTPPRHVQVGKASQASIPRLSDLVGVRLDGVQVAADGKHLLVTAKGYHRNVALVADGGQSAKVVRAVRVGQAPTVGSAFVSPDGARFGASARVTARFGQAMHLVDARSGRTQVFAGFGDIGNARNHFAVSDDGGTVVTPGTYGVVCWRRQTDGSWREAWAIDYWKEFQKLDWPVADKRERIPQFHAFIPRGADHALILFGEFSNQGWVTPDNPCSSWLAAVALSDGKERWRFDVPIPKTLLFPTLHASANGSRLLLQVQMGSWNKETFRFFTVADGKALGSWDAKVAPLCAAVADGTGHCALAFERRLLELRRPDGALVHNLYWKSQPVSVAFAPDGESIFLADDAERLSRVDSSGGIVWQRPLGSVAALAAAGGRVYAARWDGRLQAWSAEGELVWTLDCTPAMVDPDPMATVVASAKLDPAAIVQATRPATTVTTVPEGENLLRTGKATLTLGGTKSWMSDGKVQVKPESLTNGKTDDVETPWLHLDELFWDATAGRQVFAEIAFKEPTGVRAVTVYEHPDLSDSWPTEGLVQVWDEILKRWNTAAFGVHLRGPVQTYRLDLKGVTKLRYVPWNSYYRNFTTSEIEVR